MYTNIYTNNSIHGTKDLDRRRSEGEVATVQALIDRMAEASPKHVYLVSPETRREWDCLELQRQSNILGANLSGLGLVPGDKVAFMMDNGLFTAGLFLGAMYGGFVPVPLNVRAGRSQLAYVLGHSDAKVVFASDAYASSIEAARAEVGRQLIVVRADEDRPPWPDETGCVARGLTEVLPDQDALLMYTSGSTGHPKGAILSHRQVLAGAWNAAIPHELSPADRSLCVLPLYHLNAAAVTLLPTLLTGGSVVIPHHFVVRHFWDWIAEHRCTWSALVPTIIAQLLEWGDPRAEGKGEALDRIRFMRSSSAPLAPSLHRAFEEKFGIPLLEAMGSTESGGNVFTNPLPPGKDKIGTPGRPFGFEARILGPDGTEMPPGESGEISLRGPSIMRGYYKNPEETAAVLDADGWLRTGDLAYVDEDGYFFIVGRAKELIIKGGMNIAPRQIDEGLLTHPAVLDAAALGVPDHHFGEEIVAFVIPKPGAAVDEQQLLDHCQGLLGSFKTPSRIFLVPELPKGPSGKVQRLRLGECFQEILSAYPLPAAPNAGPAVAGPDGLSASAPTPVEEIIAEAWAELLKVPRVDAHDNFFGLGGHSLLAIEILCRLRKQFAVSLSLNDFFTRPTVAEQAALVAGQVFGVAGVPASREALEDLLVRRRGAMADSRVIPPRDRSTACPLSPAQERVWFLEQVHPGMRAYYDGEAVRLLGKLDIGLLERSLNIVIERHEILRTIIRLVEGRPVQVVQDDWPIAFERIDLSNLPGARREAEVERLVTEQLRQPFDLAAAPGIRATVVRLSDAEHIFVSMIHHIICDGWSLGILYRELGEIYRALTRGEPHQLPAPPLQYAEFAAWQRQQIAGGAFAEEAAFWKEYLRGAPDHQDLPTDYPRPATFTFRGEKRIFALGPAATERIRGFSRHEGVSIFMTLMAALNVLLYRYTGRDDVVLGVPIANRDRPELATLFGFLIAFQAMRTDLSGNPTFRELVRRVRKGLLDVNAHRAIPFDMVVEAVRPPRDPSRAPLFQILVIWKDRNVQMQYMELDGLAVSHVNAHTRAAKYDLTVYLTDAGEQIWLELEYCTDLFAAETIDRMVGHFGTLLEAAVAGPEERLDSLPLLTTAERHQLLSEWNATEADYPKDSCVHELFEAQAGEFPDKIAVVCEDCAYTYHELNQHSDRLAQHLRTLGVGPDVLVGLYLDRSAEMVVGLLGILKAGGAYLPMDPAYPADRLGYMLEDARPRAIVTQQSLAATLPPHTVPVVFLKASGPQTGAGRRESQEHAAGNGTSTPPPDATSLAYVLYTSGSTGQPKGVAITHRAVVNLLTSMRAEPGLAADDRLLAVTTLAFDIAALELFLPLTTGASVVIAGRDDAVDGRRLAALLDQSGATVMQATPATWRMMLEVGWRGDRRLKALCGGEALPRDVAEQLLPRCGALWNLYGPTETTIWSAACRVLPGRPIVIGRPIANTRFYVLDRRLQPVPVGVPGELFIGGAGLARGYLHRPELTAERFIDDPFGPGSGGWLYRTGDCVRYRPDGCLEFLGRFDQQVKVRGHRIELGEIEAALARHPQVRDQVVVARADASGENRLVAYLVPADGLAPEVGPLRAFLEQALPAYMVPTVFVVLDALPLTANNKVDRKALPDPDLTGGLAPPGYAPPTTEAEEKLATLWAEALGLDRVGIQDNFFDLGGHSLMATRLFTRIEAEFGRSIPLATLFRAQTVAKMASILENPSDPDSPEKTVAIRTGTSGRPPLFLTHTLSGELLCWRELLEHLGTDRPVHGLKLPEKDGVPQAFPEIAATAEYHLQAIREIQPEGPYFLMGYSFGATLALEIAQQLVARGEPVALLAVVDSAAFPRRLQSLFQLPTLYYFTQNLGPWIFNLLGSHPREATRILRRTVRNVAARIGLTPAPFPSVYKTLGFEAFEDVERLPEYYRRTVEINYGARARYSPRPYPGRVTVFRARTRFVTDLSGQDMGWAEIAQGGVDVRVVPGQHANILKMPNVRCLGDQLKAALERAETQVSSGARPYQPPNPSWAHEPFFVCPGVGR